MRLRLLFSVFAFALIFSGCSLNLSSKLHEYSDMRVLMGTDVEITVYSFEPVDSVDAVNAAFNEIERINALLSNYENDSEVSRLNKEGIIHDASDDLLYNIEKAVYYSRLSDGAFDITIEPLLSLWRNVGKTGVMPTDEEIERAKSLVNYENIYFDKKNKLVRLASNEMGINLGGIAKGYAVDRAIKILMDTGIESALVNAGGDLRAIGKKPGGMRQVALRNPRDENDFIAKINIINSSVATSGDYERYFVEKKVHHILNPRTGYSADELISVTIVAEKAIDADALATAVFVLGPEQGLKLVEARDGVEGLLITKDKEIIRSSGFGW